MAAVAASPLADAADADAAVLTTDYRRRCRSRHATAAAHAPPELGQYQGDIASSVSPSPSSATTKAAAKRSGQQLC